MTQKPSSNAAAFVAVGALYAAWKVAPSASGSDIARTYQWFGAGMAAFVAVTLGLQAIRSSESRPSPWPSRTGRVLWALRPRSFVIAWAAIGIAVWIFGTPHLAIEYPPRPCTYFGMTGVHRVPASSACPWWVWR